MEKCPSCGSNRVYRSKTRTPFERFRRRFTMKRPYRCHVCQWRGWAPGGLRAALPGNAREPAATAPDLEAADGALDGPARKTDG